VTRSIRTTLLLSTGAVLFGVLSLAGLLLYASFERELLARVDQALADEAKLVCAAVEVERGELELDLEELSATDLRPGGAALLEIRVRLARGGEEVLYRSPSLGEHALPALPPGGGWLELPGEKGRGRALRLPFRPQLDDEDPGVSEAPELLCVLARPAAAVEGALEVLRRRLLAVGALALIALSLALTLAIRAALRPLEALGREIAAIDHERLAQRVEVVGAPRELAPVIERANALLGRLDVAFQRERSLTSEVAHELRTPLAGVRTSLEVLLRQPRERADYERALAGAVEQLDRLGGLIEKLLALGRLEGELALDPRALDLNEALLEAWEPLEGRARERGLEVVWELDPLCPAESDPNLLFVVLRNLLENAVDYADAGGSLWLRSEARACALTIENTGSELEPAEVALATQRFWRKDAARSEAGLPCGLGLALAQRAAARLDASLELSSERGGRFRATLRLPSQPAPAPALAGA